MSTLVKEYYSPLVGLDLPSETLVGQEPPSIYNNRYSTSVSQFPMISIDLGVVCCAEIEGVKGPFFYSTPSYLERGFSDSIQYRLDLGHKTRRIKVPPSYAPSLSVSKLPSVQS